ncbi:MAG: xylulokinase, partial [Anaerolineales bacterium]|nr:xylulokinase [Anaerolineales bacterium]
LLADLGLPADWFPPTFEGPAVTGQISRAAAAATGLPAGLPVVAGGGDQAANAVGTGAVTEDVLALSLGTSGVVFATVDKPMIEPEGRLHAFCHAVPGKWHLMGVMLSAAGSLRWYRDTLAPGQPYEALLAPAEGVPAGSDGLFFLPYLTGERTPHPDPWARGGFIGLTARHGQPHLTRAVLEGVAFGLRDGFELMKAAGLAGVQQIRASGGGTRSRLWRQILADILGVAIVAVNSSEGAAYGAAILAAVGAGQFSSVAAACRQLIQVTEQIDPSAAAAAYNELYPLYRELYPALKPTFDQLAG